MAPPGKIQFKEIELVSRPEQVKGYTEFNRKSELYDYADENLKHDKGIYDSKGNLNAKGRQLEIYKNRENEWFSKANTALRTMKIEDIPEELKKEIRLLDSALENKTIDKYIVVYRHMGPILDKYNKGEIFPEYGYMSTSCSLDYTSYLWDDDGRNGYVARIRLPKGTNAIQIETALKRNNKHDEGELLLMREKYFKILHIDHDKKWVEMELITE